MNDVRKQLSDRLDRSRFEVSQYRIRIEVVFFHDALEKLIGVIGTLTDEQSVRQWDDLRLEQSMKCEQLIEIVRTHLK